MRGLSLVLALATSVGLSAHAHAKGWQVCNRTPEHLTVAIAYKDGSDQWISRGWHSLRRCGGCAWVMDHARTEYSDVYLHAETANGVERFGGDARFYVTSTAFEIRNPHHSKCGGGARVASFAKQVIRSDERNFTTNLNPGNGPVCIDPD